MDWGQIALWGGLAALLVFAVITVVWAPGRREDPGRDPGRGSGRDNTKREPAGDPGPEAERPSPGGSTPDSS